MPKVERAFIPAISAGEDQRVQPSKTFPWSWVITDELEFRWEDVMKKLLTVIFATLLMGAFAFAQTPWKPLNPQPLPPRHTPR
jgi:hypothetical protein